MNKPSHEYCKDCKDWNDNITNCFEICGIPIDIMKEWEKYRAIGTVEECRDAVRSWIGTNKMNSNRNSNDLSS